MGLDFDAVYSDAWRLYKLLFRRSVLTAALVFVAVAAFDQLSRRINDREGAAILLGLVSFLLGLSAPVLVQGALIELVRDIHDGRPAKRIRELLAIARARLWPLLGASILYGFGVVFGFILLIVPGFVVAARWALMAPFVVLESNGVFEANRNSSQAVRGETGEVVWLVVVTYLIINVPAVVATFLLPGGFWVTVVFMFIWNSLTAPFSAHVLTVLYYRLTDPDRPVIHDAVLTWPSVWQAA